MFVHINIKQVLSFALVLLSLFSALCVPAFAADASVAASQEDVFIIDNEEVPLSDSIWGSEPASVFITREFYRSGNTITVPRTYFDAIDSDKSIDEKAKAAFWEAQRQSCYLFGDGSVHISAGGNSVTITRNPFFSPAEEAEMRSVVNDEADRILAQIITPGMSDYQKAYAIFQYVSGASYDWTAYHAITGGDCQGNIDKWAKAVSAYGNLIDRESVCQGDAQAFILLARKAGLTAMMATGTMTNGGGHAWNRVWVNSQWYEVDCCTGLFCSSFSSYSAQTGIVYGGVGIIESSANSFYGV